MESYVLYSRLLGILFGSCYEIPMISVLDSERAMHAQWDFPARTELSPRAGRLTGDIRLLRPLGNDSL